MMDDQERRLLLDLVTAALGALQTSQKIASRVKAVEVVLKYKGNVTAEEIDEVERALPVNQLLSSDPEKIQFMKEWNSLSERLEEARLRLSQDSGE